MRLPRQSPEEISEISLAFLRRVVAIDSQSDEDSSSVPTTEGQARLAEELERIFAAMGATVERDAFANVIATLPGRGAGVGCPPLALMVHLDTARGTSATDRLSLLEAWDGGAIPYPENPGLSVSVQTYPDLQEFLGQTLVHGPGRAPFGLDDKLGLSHVLTLARLIADNPEVDHPPLMLVARPDEEVGREEAIHALAEQLAARGVAFGYTVDGLLPFEVNVENFNAAVASVWFPARPAPSGFEQATRVQLGGVNTHGATARAEGHRGAIRFAVELAAHLIEAGTPLPFVEFETDDLREVDATLVVLHRPGQRALVEQALTAVVGPHVPRGATWSVAPAEPPTAQRCGTGAMLAFVRDFLASQEIAPLLPEDSDGSQGYSSPFRAVADGDTLRLDLRLRDFSVDGLRARASQVLRMAEDRGLRAKATDQYTNMGPKLASHPYLAEWPKEVGEAIGVQVRQRPIRGGTGVDPFLQRGVPVANLGTGYFAPESEKEFTSLEMLAGHATWLFALVQRVATG
ncbi:MAG: hypothetical protein H6741_19360 [Alphaproteobacteria bacterium]|nr:hypothetical protein [Alphaproteobacteria bacterium]